MPDGVYRCGADGVPGFIEAGALTDDELDALLHTIIARPMKMRTRRGVLVEDMGQAYLAEPDTDGEEARTLRPLFDINLEHTARTAEHCPNCGVGKSGFRGPCRGAAGPFEIPSAGLHFDRR